MTDHIYAVMTIHQKQYNVEHLVQAHTNMYTGGTRNQTTTFSNRGRLTPICKPQLHVKVVVKLLNKNTIITIIIIMSRQNASEAYEAQCADNVFACVPTSIMGN